MKSIYLVAYYFKKPANTRVKTTKSGWMLEPKNINYDEQVALTRNLRDKDLTTSSIILDLVNKKIVKNTWHNQRSFTELFMYYHDNYPQHTRDIMLQVDSDYYYKMYPTSKKDNNENNSFGSSVNSEVVTINTP